MTDIEALKESLSQELFQKEPLAFAIMLFLNEHEPGTYTKICDKFDEVISKKVDRMVADALEEESACKENSELLEQFMNFSRK